MQSLTADLEAAAAIGADERGGVSRFAWTPELARANDWLTERLTELGLDVELDPAGNVIGRWSAGEGNAVLLGSHLDTVPNGGRYDGALGVLAALDVVRRLKADGRRAEPAAVGRLLQRRGRMPLPDRNARQPRVLRGLRPGGLGAARRPGGDGRGRVRLRPAGRRPRARRVGAYLELHIEQGPVLERAGVDLGVVTAITGMVGFRARFLGEANHAGTTPMELRRDALSARPAPSSSSAPRHAAVTT